MNSHNRKRKIDIEGVATESLDLVYDHINPYSPPPPLTPMDQMTVGIDSFFSVEISTPTTTFPSTQPSIDMPSSVPESLPDSIDPSLELLDLLNFPIIPSLEALPFHPASMLSSPPLMPTDRISLPPPSDSKEEVTPNIDRIIRKLGEKEVAFKLYSRGLSHGKSLFDEKGNKVDPSAYIYIPESQQYRTIQRIRYCINPFDKASIPLLVNGNPLSRRRQKTPVESEPSSPIKTFMIEKEGKQVLLQFKAKISRSKRPHCFTKRPTVEISQKEYAYTDRNDNLYIVKNNKAYEIRSVRAYEKQKRVQKIRKAIGTVIPEDLPFYKAAQPILAETKLSSSPQSTTTSRPSLMPISTDSSSHIPSQVNTSPISLLRSQSIFPPVIASRLDTQDSLLRLDEKDHVLKYLIDENDSTPRVWPAGNLNFVDGVASVKNESGAEMYTFPIRMVEQNNMIIGEAISPEEHSKRIDHRKMLLEYMPLEKNKR